MNRLLFFVLMSISLNAFSQKDQGKIMLTKGQKFIVKDTVSQEADMGMGMTMKNSSTVQNNFVVLDVNDKNYLATKTLTGLKISMSMMGQEANYDSDKKEDSASDIGKSIENLNVPDSFTIDKYTGIAHFTKKVRDTSSTGSNPLEGIFESMGNVTDNNSSESFFVIPAGKKIGDSWIDSSSTKEIKTVKKYTLRSIDKTTATISLDGNVVSNIQTEAQGMQITVSMTTKTTGEMIIDKKTSLINRKNTKADISGTLDMMGQSVPVTGKATTVSVYEY